jgi:hypothetical protein
MKWRLLLLFREKSGLGAPFRRTLQCIACEGSVPRDLYQGIWAIDVVRAAAKGASDQPLVRAAAARLLFR